MSERIYEEALGLAMKALKKVVQSEDDSPSGVEMLKNSLSAACKAQMLMEDGGYSRDGGYSNRRDSMGRYARDDGYSRENYSRDSYSRDRGYSNHDDRTRKSLERMYEEATSQKERDIIRRLMDGQE